MDSYIVRVYRRGQGKTDEIAGLVEKVGSSQRSSFRTLKGLVSTVRQVIGREGLSSEETGKLEGDNKRNVHAVQTLK